MAVAELACPVQAVDDERVAEQATEKRAVLGVGAHDREHGRRTGRRLGRLGRRPQPVEHDERGAPGAGVAQARDGPVRVRLVRHDERARPGAQRGVERQGVAVVARHDVGDGRRLPAGLGGQKGGGALAVVGEARQELALGLGGVSGSARGGEVLSR